MYTRKPKEELRIILTVMSLINLKTSLQKNKNLKRKVVVKETESPPDEEIKYTPKRAQKKKQVPPPWT